MRPAHSAASPALALALALVACASVEDPTTVEDTGGDADAMTFDTGLEASPPVCGDGILDDDEECDDHNEVDADACSNACLRNPAALCAGCEADGDCGREADLCLEANDGTFCGRDCAETPCPDGYVCADIEDDDGELVAQQCAPETGWCGACPDADGDEVCDDVDRCPLGDDRVDDDSDGVPDACDLCEGENDAADADGDQAPDACDRCPGGDDSDDADGDGAPDACDACAGADDRDDADSDGVPDACDVCSEGDDHVDSDSDGVPDACDACSAGDDGPDADSDTVPDACDVCPGGNDTLDGDADGVPDFCDRCPGADDRLDADSDGVPDFCDVCAGGDDGVDTDSDGVPDFCDCDAAGCDTNALCTESSTGATCTCRAGFRGDGIVCSDIDECDEALAECDVHADCNNLPGDFECVCFDGWEGTGEVCTDIDECEDALDECADAATCSNVDGGYDCACLPGYQGDGFTCNDIDECALGLAGCADDATCNNFGGGFTCDCNGALLGNGRACFPSTRVLVYRDHIASRADAAAQMVGLPFSLATNETEFNAAFDDGGHGLIVIDAPNLGLGAGLRARLTDWVRTGGDVVFSWWNLDTDAELRALFGIGSVVEFTTWRDVYADPGSPTAIFDYMESLPTPLTGNDAFFDDGDELTLGGAGFLMGRFDSPIGPGAIALTLNRHVVVNGFLLAEANTADADTDGVPDVQELIANEMAVVLESSGCEMLEGFEEATWPISPWVIGKVESLYPGTVDNTTPRHGGFGIKNVGWYYTSAEQLGQGDRVSAWVRTSSAGGRAYLGFGATSTGARSLLLAPNTSQLAFQVNDNYDFTDAASVSQTYVADTWYRLEVEYVTSSRVTGRVYDADGGLVRSLTHDFGTARAGGVAIRGFGDVAIDSVTVCRP